MSNNRKIFITLYFALVAVVILTSSTLAKYTTNVNTTGSFEIGNKLYFNYTRSNLYRNDKLIIGKEVEYEDENGDIHQRIETMNVVPGDGLKYTFYVSNFNPDTKEMNGISGAFVPISNAIISLPVKQQTYDIDCLITYREVPLDEDGNDIANNTNTFTTLTNNITLPKVTTASDRVKYEFQVTVILDDQIADTSSDDYFGATLNIFIFINGASNELNN